MSGSLEEEAIETLLIRQAMTYPEFMTWAADRKKLSLSEADAWWQEMRQAEKANKKNECKDIMQEDSSAQAAMVPQKWFRRSWTWVEDDEDDV